MKKFKNRLKKIIAMVMTVAALLCCSVVSAFADEEASDPNLNVGSTFDGKIIPYLPEEVYGKNYILVYQGYDKFLLYVLPDDSTVTGKQDNGSTIYTGGGSVVLTFNFPTDTLCFTYSYSSSDGWSEPSVSSGSSTSITPPAVYLLKSTVNIMSSSSTGTVFYGANTSIIYRPDYKLVLSGFGSMLSGFMSSLSGCAIGMFCFACICCVGFIGLITRVINRRF